MEIEEDPLEKARKETLEYYRNKINGLNPSENEKKTIDLYCNTMYQLQQLGSSNPNIRSKNLLSLQQNLGALVSIEPTEGNETIISEEVFENIYKLIENMINSVRWEDKYAALQALKILNDNYCELKSDFEVKNILYILMLIVGNFYLWLRIIYDFFWLLTIK